MPARPIETFQSEGWYAPTSARAEHYFRPSDEATEDLGTPALASICGRGWSIGGGLRPHLTPSPRGNGCKRCTEIQHAALWSDGEWFAPTDRTDGGGR